MDFHEVTIASIIDYDQTQRFGTQRREDCVVDSIPARRDGMYQLLIFLRLKQAWNNGQDSVVISGYSRVS